MTTNIIPAPLETIALPAELSGANGLNRAPERPYIPAEHDLDAIKCWLSRVEQRSKHTQESYKREAERILLWALMVKRKPLSSLDMTDISEYRSFLLNPQPAEVWIGKKHNKGHADWKPFTGPLSDRSAKHADTILGNLFKFLTQQKYLLQNPYSALPKMIEIRKNGSIDVDRSLSVSQWEFVTDFLQEKLITTDSVDRLKWSRTNMIVQFLYVTGLRIHELAKAKIGDIVRIERQSGAQYWLKVIGKGQKYREVPVPQKTYRMMNATYLQLTGLSIVDANEEDPLIPPLRPRKNQGNYFLKRLSIHKILKEFFQMAAIDLLDTDPEASKKLSRASTHWLRHTHGSHAVRKDIPLTVIRDNLGHSSISTTSQYVHADQDERHDAMDKLVG